MGYDISIDRVASQAGTILVEVTATSPDERCIVLAVITSPVMMVRVPASAGSVQFEERARIQSCD